MTYNDSKWNVFTDIAAINRWIEQANEESMHKDSMCVMKIGEEFGEAVAAYIGMTGQNPRKGYTHTKSDLYEELCDIAITALVALEHFTGSPIITQGFMASRISKIIARSNIPPYLV